MGDSRAGRLLRNVEGVAYWVAAAPVLARLPAALGYRLACWRGDWLFRCQAGKRAELARNLRLVLGNELSAGGGAAGDPGLVPARLLRGGRREAAAARGAAPAAAGRDPWPGTPGGRAGRGQGSHPLLPATSAPTTAASRCCTPAASRSPPSGAGSTSTRAGLSSAERRFWELVYARPLRRHRQRPNIEPWPGRLEVAALAAAALRANEVVTISIDAPPLDSDRARAVEVPFLGRPGRLLPGAVTLAQVTGAPLLMGFLYRAADYRHQVWRSPRQCRWREKRRRHSSAAPPR